MVEALPSVVHAATFVGEGGEALDALLSDGLLLEELEVGGRLTFLLELGEDVE